MKTKAAFLIGAGVGYVFGTAAGRQKFEQIKGQANTLWHNESVQHTVSDLQEKATDLAKNQGGALAEKVTSTVKSKLKHDDDASGGDSATANAFGTGSSTSAGVADGPTTGSTAPSPDVSDWKNPS
ncbi:hypothetical protein GCM10011331_09520 [Flavimobilis marinus]|uniref:YtxH domain-containing protein n=1 Tax=Flavimobilis marinus TaxID=285351 RepID=A0A1I2CCG3_9MICO|nr:hypothetical protein [Flavimobilis marinus]GHG48043.1 hypothetical protein GCM10011331_09520 [Flavimobilis marinus]SFE65360.1 hypothetical protein SAMN04488035_0036 [Flavimobilis marinus]